MDNKKPTSGTPKCRQSIYTSHGCTTNSAPPMTKSSGYRALPKKVKIIIVDKRYSPHFYHHSSLFFVTIPLKLYDVNNILIENCDDKQR